MSRIAAIAFNKALEAALYDAAHPHFLNAQTMVQQLAREFRDGVPALLQMLQDEMALGHEEARALAGRSDTLHSHLMVVWVKGDDEKALLALTGRGRDAWLNRNWWPAPDVTRRLTSSPA